MDAATRNRGRCRNLTDNTDAAADALAPARQNPPAPVGRASGSRGSTSPAHRAPGSAAAEAGAEPLAPPEEPTLPAEPQSAHLLWPLPSNACSLWPTAQSSRLNLPRLLGTTPAAIEAALGQLGERSAGGRPGPAATDTQRPVSVGHRARNGRRLVEAFLNLDATTRLSGPALEALAVIAYRQPVTRAQIEAVRGVDCSGVLRSLQQRGLIEEVGRLDAPGRPVLYGVTDLFMQHFGLMGLSELPPLGQTEIGRLDDVLLPGEMPVTARAQS